MHSSRDEKFKLDRRQLFTLGALTCWLLLAAGSPSAGAQGSTRVANARPSYDLPSDDCLRGLRSARIAHMTGDHEQELVALNQTLDVFADELMVLEAMLTFHRSHATDPAKAQQIRARLVAELTAPTVSWPISILAPFVQASANDLAVLEAVRDHLERRYRRGETKDEELLTMLGPLAQQTGDLDLETSVIESEIALRPDSVSRWRLLSLYRQQERWEDMLTFLQAWVQVEPDTPFLRRSYIQTLSQLGHIEELDLELERLSQQILAPTMPNRAELSLDYGGILKSSAWRLRDAGRDDSAERLFRQALELDPEDQEASQAVLHLYGSAAELQQMKASQEQRWQEEADPRSLFDEGTARLTAGDTEAALELLRRAAPGLPDLEPAWYNLGMAAYRMKDWQTVDSAFEHAAQLEPGRAQSHFYRGLALEKLDRCQPAVISLETALQLDASRTLAHYFLATCYRKLGDNAKASHHSLQYQKSQLK